MLRRYAVVAALALVTCAGLPQEALAKTGPGGLQSRNEAQGRIVDVRAGNLTRWDGYLLVTLTDGTQVTVPDTVAKLSELQDGAFVRMPFEVKDGRNVATSIIFMDGAQGQQG